MILHAYGYISYFTEKGMPEEEPFMHHLKPGTLFRQGISLYIGL